MHYAPYNTGSVVGLDSLFFLVEYMVYNSGNLRSVSTKTSLREIGEERLK